MTENNMDAPRPSDLVQDPGLIAGDAAPAADAPAADAAAADAAAAEAPVAEAPAEEVPAGDAADAAEEQRDLPPAEEEQLLEALRDVVDPELGINVVDLGLVYGLHIDPDSSVVVDMTLTSAACPLTDVIEAQVDSALEDLAKSSKINWVWMPPWTPEKITDDGREQLRMLGFNV